MSWAIKAIGSTEAVKTAIQKNQSLTPSLKAALSEMCDDKPWGNSGHNGLFVEGSGHGGEGSYINALKVERITIAYPDAPPSVK